MKLGVGPSRVVASQPETGPIGPLCRGRGCEEGPPLSNCRGGAQGAAHAPRAATSHLCSPAGQRERPELGALPGAGGAAPARAGCSREVCAEGRGRRAPGAERAGAGRAPSSPRRPHRGPGRAGAASSGAPRRAVTAQAPWNSRPGQPRMAVPRSLLLAAWLPLSLLPAGLTQETPPPGCGKDLPSLYYNLCNLSAPWGIVLEALASLGIASSFVLCIVLVASLPFMQDPRKKSLVGTQVLFLLGTFGLFCLTFDFIVKPSFSTCASRRFLFGVLFGICFSCLAAHAGALNVLARRNQGLPGWLTFGAALLLALVEMIINAEWLLITVVRSSSPSQSPCAVDNKDFVMALIFVMFLLLAAFATAWPALCGRYRHWRKHAVFILLTTSLSMAVWVVWIVMYLYGNQQRGSLTWDDPTLAIALVTNASIFIIFYVVPELCHVTRPGPEQAYENDAYPTRGVGYETILKEQKAQSMFVENKAFSMDEPASAKKPVSPYSGYNGQLVTSVFQPTEMALMHKGPPEGSYDLILPRATANSQAIGSANSTLRAEDAYAAQSQHAAAQDGWGLQAPAPYSKNRW